MYTYSLLSLLVPKPVVLSVYAFLRYLSSAIWGQAVTVRYWVNRVFSTGNTVRYWVNRVFSTGNIIVWIIMCVGGLGCGIFQFAVFVCFSCFGCCLFVFYTKKPSNNKTNC